jgi:flagellar biosynthesis chaperone FliJ
MQGSIRQLITTLHETNETLKELYKKEKEQRTFLSTSLSDARLSIREHKKQIARLEKKYERLKNFRKKGIASLFKIN